MWIVGTVLGRNASREDMIQDKARTGHSEQTRQRRVFIRADRQSVPTELGCRLVALRSKAGISMQGSEGLRGLGIPPGGRCRSAANRKRAILGAASGGGRLPAPRKKSLEVVAVLKGLCLPACAACGDPLPRYAQMRDRVKSQQRELVAVLFHCSILTPSALFGSLTRYASL